MPSTIPTPIHWRVRLAVVGVLALGLPAGAALLYAYPPGPGTYYPTCMFHALTGLHCPGCGGTRCASALVHGDFPQAMAYNPLLVVCSPLLGLALFSVVYRGMAGRRAGLPRFPAWTGHVIFWVIIAYWVLRNVPVHPFTLLAPHML